MFLQVKCNDVHLPVLRESQNVIGSHIIIIIIIVNIIIIIISV